MLKVREGTKEYGLISIVYGSLASDLRRSLWSDLSVHNIGVEGPWISLGDYNVVLNKNEVRNPESFNERHCSGFKYWMFSEGLTDIGCSGSRSMWLRGKSGTMFKGARLDRGLANIQWCEKFPDRRIKQLPFISLNHVPILFSFNEGRNIEKRSGFRFQAMWMTHPDYHIFIDSTWNNQDSIVGNTTKVTKELATWNREVFGNVTSKKKKLLERIEGIKKNLVVNFHNGLRKLDIKLRKELEEILYQEELLWFQKSREQWIKSGDRNTSYYHSSTIVHRARNKVETLRDDNGSLGE